MTKFAYPAFALLAIAGIALQEQRLLQAAMAGIIAWTFVGKRLSAGNKGGARQNDTLARFNDQWTAAARELGFTAREGRKQRPATMHGVLDGHKANVIAYGGTQPEIEVRFSSGLRNLDIDGRREGTVRIGNTNELPTGDPSFDQLYRISAAHDENMVMRWLTPERRSALVTLGETLNVQEVEEDELEVKLGTTIWQSTDLVEAVRLCVVVAKILDESYASPVIQDAPIQDEVIQDPDIQDAVIDDKAQ